jgi:hypothetical protein
MHIHYNVRRGRNPVPNYVCFGRGRGFGDPSCQSILGTEIDAVIGKLVIEAVEPMALELALAVQEEITARLDDADRLRYHQVERTQHEVDRARQRYMQVDPTNRLVADSLEAEWNVKLRALQIAQDEYERQRTTERLDLDKDDGQRILELATNFPAVWCDPNTPQRERKRMLGLLIEDVTLIKEQHITCAIRFRGGATETRTLPRPLTAQQLRATHEDVRKQIDELLDEYTDAQVAHVLNERGLRTGAGDAFDPSNVRWVRFSHKLKSLKQRLQGEGWLLGKHTERELGVSRSTLARWRKTGRIKARICNGLGEWLYCLTPDGKPLPAPASARTTGQNRSTARGAV